MQIDAHKDVGRLGKVAQALLSDPKNAHIAKGLANTEIRIGPASDDRYGTDAGAYHPLYVGDSSYLAKKSAMRLRLPSPTKTRTTCLCSGRGTTRTRSLIFRSSLL